MTVIVGPRCDFCDTEVCIRIPNEVAATMTKQEAAQRLDQFFSIHLMRHVDDFLYGEGGVFADGAIDRPGGQLRPPDPPA